MSLAGSAEEITHQQVTSHFHLLHSWGTHEQPARACALATLTSTRFVKQVEVTCHLMHADFAYAGFYTFDGKEREAGTYADTIGHRKEGTLFMEQQQGVPLHLSEP